MIQFKNKTSYSKWLFLIFISFSFLLIYFTPNFQKRFNSISPEGIDIYDIGSRAIHWKGVLNRIGNENLIFGSGTGDGHTALYEEYLKLNFKTGYLHKYNAHNQYLETTLFYGFIGLFLLLWIFYVAIKKCLQAKDIMGLSIICVFIIFMCTESILERHSGIVLFAFLSSMIVATNNKSIINNLKN